MITLKKNYDNKSKLFFTVTDSLMFEIKTEGVYKDFRCNQKIYRIEAKKCVHFW